jgi:hypothetical protein
MKDKLIMLGLIILGSLQMIGDLCHTPLIKGIGQATNASPAPKVFTSQNGYETFSKRFFFKIINKQGLEENIEISPTNYQYLAGPYNRRNMYGAAISYSPVLVNSVHTKSMFESVAKYGLCNHGESLLDEMRIDYDKTQPITLFIQPRRFEENNHWQQSFTFECKGENYA